MSSIDINSVLSQIRSLNAQASARPSAALPPLRAEAAAAQPGQSGFGELVSRGIDRVAAVQGQASRLQQAFELGDADVDLASVMIASAKAQVSFRAMVEVRNRAVAAYQDIMNMPL